MTANISWGGVAHWTGSKQLSRCHLPSDSYGCQRRDQTRVCWERVLHGCCTDRLPRCWWPKWNADSAGGVGCRSSLCWIHQSTITNSAFSTRCIWWVSFVGLWRLFTRVFFLRSLVKLVTRYAVMCTWHKQGDHLSEKPGNVREFESCQGNVRDFTKSQGTVREKILSGKSCLKLFIVSCILCPYSYLELVQAWCE